MAYENKNGEELTTATINLFELSELFSKATDDLLKEDADVYKIMADLEYEIANGGE